MSCSSALNCDSSSLNNIDDTYQTAQTLTTLSKTQVCSLSTHNGKCISEDIAKCSMCHEHSSCQSCTKIACQSVERWRTDSSNSEFRVCNICVEIFKDREDINSSIDALKPEFSNTTGSVVDNNRDTATDRNNQVNDEHGENATGGKVGSCNGGLSPAPEKTSSKDGEKSALAQLKTPDSKRKGTSVPTTDGNA